MSKRETSYFCVESLTNHVKIIPCHASVIEAFLASKYDVQPPTQFVRWQAHNLVMRIFKQRRPVESDLDV